MDHDALIAYCLAKPGAWEDQPWEDDVVAKVGSRIFAFLGGESTVGLKCGTSRDDADEWILRYPQDASPMPYLARSGWNSLVCDGGIPDDELLEAVDASYLAIVARLPKRERPTEA